MTYYNAKCAVHLTQVEQMFYSVIPGGTKKRPEHSHGVMQQSSQNKSAEKHVCNEQTPSNMSRNSHLKHFRISRDTNEIVLRHKTMFASGSSFMLSLVRRLHKNVTVIIIIIIIISTTMFMVLSSWQSHARVHPVHLMNAEWRQAAADPRPSQTT